MHSKKTLGLAATAALRVTASSLANVCTTSYIQSALPLDAVSGITLDSNSITANAVYNYTSEAGDLWIGGKGLDFCNVTLAYTRNGISNSTVSFCRRQRMKLICRPTFGTGSPAPSSGRAAT